MKPIQFQQIESRLGSAGRSCIARAGFTLIELMLVLGLIAIMAAMIVPEMKGSMEDAVLRSSARQVIDLFNLTYSRAVSLNRQHRVRLDAHNEFHVEQQSLDLLTAGIFQPIQDSKEFHGEIDSRIQITIRPPRRDTLAEQMPEEDSSLAFFRDDINFYPDGTADGCEIVLRDRMGVELVLQLNPITATLRILDEETP